jgi:hypothetical protein
MAQFHSLHDRLERNASIPRDSFEDRGVSPQTAEERGVSSSVANNQGLGAEDSGSTVNVSRIEERLANQGDSLGSEKRKRGGSSNIRSSRGRLIDSEILEGISSLWFRLGCKVNLLYVKYSSIHG